MDGGRIVEEGTHADARRRAAASTRGWRACSSRLARRRLRTARRSRLETARPRRRVRPSDFLHSFPPSVVQDRRVQTARAAFADLCEALPLVETDRAGIVEVDVQFEAGRRRGLGVAEQCEREPRSPSRRARRRAGRYTLSRGSTSRSHAGPRQAAARQRRSRRHRPPAPPAARPAMAAAPRNRTAEEPCSSLRPRGRPARADRPAGKGGGRRAAATSLRLRPVTAP